MAEMVMQGAHLKSPEAQCESAIGRLGVKVVLIGW
jgi:hypothetical protein